jgi:hypothetical protein
MSLARDFELLRERRQNRELWAQAAAEIGATHAFTFNPDYGLARNRAEAESFIRGIASKLYKEMNRTVRGLSQRDSRWRDHPDRIEFIGSYELKDGRELLYPHAHLAIALRPGEDIKVHQFMLRRWGSRERCIITGREEYLPAWERPIFTHASSKPEYYLTELSDLRGWMGCAAKQSDEFTLPALPGEFLKPMALREA